MPITLVSSSFGLLYLLQPAGLRLLLLFLLCSLNFTGPCFDWADLGCNHCCCTVPVNFILPLPSDREGSYCFRRLNNISTFYTGEFVRILCSCWECFLGERFGLLVLDVHSCLI